MERVATRGGHAGGGRGHRIHTITRGGHAGSSSHSGLGDEASHQRLHDTEDEDSDYDYEDDNDGDDTHLNKHESSFADTPRDTFRRPRITRVAKKFGNNTVHRSITRIFIEHYDRAWITFRQVPKDVKAHVYSHFGTLWSWDPAAEESTYEGFVNVLKSRFRGHVRQLRVKSTVKARADGYDIAEKDYTQFKIIRDYPPDTVPLEMWRELCANWDTREWLKKSKSGTSNRSKEDSIGKTSRHTGGSIGFDEHHINLKRKLGKEPCFLQIFLNTHLTKDSKAKFWAGDLDLHSLVEMEFFTQRAREAYEAYLTKMSEMFGPNFTHDDKDVWERVQAKDCTNRRTSNRVFGIGDSDTSYVVTGASCSFYGITPLYVEYQQSQEKVQDLESQVQDLGTQLESERRLREESEQRMEQ